jgi:hypothetical protein
LSRCAGCGTCSTLPNRILREVATDAALLLQRQRKHPTGHGMERQQPADRSNPD